MTADDQRIEGEIYRGHAAAIQSAVQELNVALASARADGLIIEIDVEEFGRTMDNPRPHQKVTVRVLREVIP